MGKTSQLFRIKWKTEHLNGLHHFLVNYFDFRKT